MNLRHLTDSCLLKDTATLVQKERECTGQLLHHLREIDRRKLFSELKCSSLFDYCTRVLGYSEGSAQRRIVASRLLNDLPEIEEKIEAGSLSLMNIASAVSFFNQESVKTPELKREVLYQLENLTRKDCEKKLFELSGREIPVREEKRRISQDSLKVSMILSDKTVEKLQEVRGLIQKTLTNEELIDFMADIVIEKLHRKKFKI